MSNWTPERVERLKALWADGKSAAEIAAQLGGVARNAVIGKVHRLNLAGRPRHAPKSAPRRAKNDGGSLANKLRAGTFGKPRPALPKAAPPRPRRDVTLSESLRVTLLDLRDGHCRFPDGAFAEPAVTYCGHPAEPIHNEFGNVVSHKPYCPAHCNLAYQPVTARQQRSDGRLSASYGRTA